MYICRVFMNTGIFFLWWWKSKGERDKKSSKLYFSIFTSILHFSKKAHLFYIFKIYKKYRSMSWIQNEKNIESNTIQKGLVSNNN